MKSVVFVLTKIGNLRTFLITMVLISFTIAQVRADEVLTNCPLTPAVWDTDALPPSFVKSNNLRRKTAASEFAKGSFIDLELKVVDSRCVPVGDAIIEIWQADADGKLFTNQYDYPHDENFAYSGTSVTNNIGIVNFFTVLPFHKCDRLPYINLRVRHENFLPFETKVYFSNNELDNSNSPVKKVLDKRKVNLLTSVRTDADDVSVKFKHVLTLEGVNKYKRY